MLLQSEVLLGVTMLGSDCIPKFCGRVSHLHIHARGEIQLIECARETVVWTLSRSHTQQFCRRRLMQRRRKSPCLLHPQPRANPRSIFLFLSNLDASKGLFLFDCRSRRGTCSEKVGGVCPLLSKGRELRRRGSCEYPARARSQNLTQMVLYGVPGDLHCHVNSHLNNSVGETPSASAMR